MIYPVFDSKGKKTTQGIELPEAVFAFKQHSHAVYLAVKAYLAAQRQGTHKSKEKSEVTASTKKIQRQKGTGNARRGSVKSNVMKGGGTTFGPRPRDYTLRVKAQTKKNAKKLILTQAAQESALVVLENYPDIEAKTKAILPLLKALEVDGRKTLFLLHEKNQNLYLALRNLAGVQMLPLESLNAYDLLDAERIICAKEGVALLEKYLA